ncbi:MAG: thymidine phosphorylase [Pseudomonadota bacterium]|jgi:thymidine phosphorylase
MTLPQELIRKKRDGQALTPPEIEAFVRGLVDGADDPQAGFSDAQCGAMAMAIVLRGMDTAETAALTHAMTHSGEVLDWRTSGLAGPILDKHSTGGVGDKVSLMLAPILAACGAVVPMVSGRGLGHTGGTLDKLEALPGYAVNPPYAQMLAALRSAGCAIVGASPRLAPADRRLYAIRDVTATVESLPLITASILSKKLAAGLGSLVMDVKVGSGAVMTSLEDARALAASLVRVARAAGLPTVALITDMSQVLGSTAGNALEVAEALAFLTGRWPAGWPRPAGGEADPVRDPRLLTLTLALAAEALVLGGLESGYETAHERARRALEDGAAAERFARMVAALGGPADVLRAPGLPAAPVLRPVPASRAGVLATLDARALGVAVVALGGGRTRPAAAIDPRVGLSGVRALGTRVRAGEPLAWVHAADAAAAEAAVAAVSGACTIAEGAPTPPPVLRGRLA